MRLDSSRALAWRLRRHALEPVSGTTVADVANRVVASRGWPFDRAELMVRIRQIDPEPGGLERALGAGEVIRSYAFRGGSYVFTPAVAAILLACRTSSRVWQTPRYQRQGQFVLEDWEPLREAVREALASGPATREEIGAHLAHVPGLGDLTVAATGFGSDSLYKPLFWWGDICFGPSRSGKATFRLLADDPGWPGLPDVDVAGPRAIELYLGSYGPATLDNLVYWLCEGLSVPRRRLMGWLGDLGSRVTEISVDGTPSFALTADLDELDTAWAADTVCLLPGFDPWVFGPGTADTRVLAPEQRASATKGANLAIRGGVVMGTWHTHGNDLVVSLLDATDLPTSDALEQATKRLARALGHDLTPRFT